jgi:hypothetical protein
VAPADAIRAASAFADRISARRSVREFYTGRASEEWLSALAPIGTDWTKPFLEIAPAVIVVFEVHQGPNNPKPYYVKESVGIALTISSAHRRITGRVSTADVAAAREASATDLEIHDTVLIAAAFCLFNRYVDGLAITVPDECGMRVRAETAVVERGNVGGDQLPFPTGQRARTAQQFFDEIAQRRGCLWRVFEQGQDTGRVVTQGDVRHEFAPWLTRQL